MKEQWNCRIICVDDEDDIVKLYKKILSPDNNTEPTELDDVFSRRQKKFDIANEIFQIERIPYELFLAHSGKEAVEIFKQQFNKNEPIAVGFIDMKMPGGMDGMETIKILKELDSD
jgi:two-component system NtrC family sensor kinase